MKVGVIGSGYVGMTTGAILAENGHDVVSVDIDPDKIAQLRQGNLPIHEPGLGEIVAKNLDRDRLHYTTDYTRLVGRSVLFLCLPTPTVDGEASMEFVLSAAKDYAKIADGQSLLVNKSTVPVGAARLVREHIAPYTKSGAQISVLSNPEFLREGKAVEDCRNPDRIVVGADNPEALIVMRKLYNSFIARGTEYVETDPESAELAKLLANALLAVKISFANEGARAAEALGADASSVLRIVGLDPRIGPQFLNPGPGWGGSCFPKDTEAAAEAARRAGSPLLVTEAAIKANERQRLLAVNDVLSYYDGDVSGKKFALLGLAFKGDTDDIRVSPAIEIAEHLLAAGAHIHAYDPQAMRKAHEHPSFKNNDSISFAENPYQAAEGADAVIIATEWAEFGEIDFGKLKAALSEHVMFDFRNMFSLAAMQESGFYYRSIGRQTIEKYVPQV